MAKQKRQEISDETMKMAEAICEAFEDAVAKNVKTGMGIECNRLGYDRIRVTNFLGRCRNSPDRDKAAICKRYSRAMKALRVAGLSAIGSRMTEAEPQGDVATTVSAALAADEPAATEPVFSLNTETTSDQLPPFEPGRERVARLRLAGSGRYDVIIIRGVASGDLASVLRSLAHADSN